MGAKKRFQIGDIVYIYNAKPSCKIICKTVVEQINIATKDKTNDTEFWSDKEAERQSLRHGVFCRLRQLALNPDSILAIDYLRELGICGFQGAQKINKEIASIFNKALLSDNDLGNIDETYPEGARIPTYVNRYERNPEARKHCIEHYKSYKCQICEFDFEKVYGDIGKEFIHIHHIVPLADIGKEYNVDPITHLIPVCPNCHAMLHRKRNGQTLTVEGLKDLLKL